MALTIERWIRHRTGRKVAILLGAVVLVFAAVGGWLVLGGAGSETDAARTVADTFVSDLESGSFAGAYGLLSSDTQATVTQAEFAQSIEVQPRHVRSHKVDGVNPSAVHPRPYVVVFVRLTFTDGIVSPRDILVVPQSGRWRVHGVPFWGIS